MARALWKRSAKISGCSWRKSAWRRSTASARPSRRKSLRSCQTGRLEYYDKLKAEFPPEILLLFELQGLGAKKIKVSCTTSSGSARSPNSKQALQGRLGGRAARLRRKNGGQYPQGPRPAARRAPGNSRIGDIMALAEELLGRSTQPPARDLRPNRRAATAAKGNRPRPRFHRLHAQAGGGFEDFVQPPARRKRAGQGRDQVQRDPEKRHPVRPARRHQRRISLRPELFHRQQGTQCRACARARWSGAGPSTNIASAKRRPQAEGAAAGSPHRGGYLPVASAWPMWNRSCARTAGEIAAAEKHALPHPDRVAQPARHVSQSYHGKRRTRFARGQWPPPRRNSASNTSASPTTAKAPCRPTASTIRRLLEQVARIRDLNDDL